MKAISNTYNNISKNKGYNKHLSEARITKTPLEETTSENKSSEINRIRILYEQYETGKISFDKLKEMIKRLYGNTKDDSIEYAVKKFLVNKNDFNTFFSRINNKGREKAESRLFTEQDSDYMLTQDMKTHKLLYNKPTCIIFGNEENKSEVDSEMAELVKNYIDGNIHKEQFQKILYRKGIDPSFPAIAKYLNTDFINKDLIFHQLLFQILKLSRKPQYKPQPLKVDSEESNKSNLRSSIIKQNTYSSFKHGDLKPDPAENIYNKITLSQQIKQLQLKSDIFNSTFNQKEPKISDFNYKEKRTCYYTNSDVFTWTNRGNSDFLPTNNSKFEIKQNHLKIKPFKGSFMSKSTDKTSAK